MQYLLSQEEYNKLREKNIDTTITETALQLKINQYKDHIHKLEDFLNVAEIKMHYNPRTCQDELSLINIPIDLAPEFIKIKFKG